MRGLADADRIGRFMKAVARASDGVLSVHLVGGKTAVLFGWRATTVDVDFVMHPERDEVLRALPAIKEELHLNVEIASPGHFIPVPSGWENRGTFIAQDGKVSFYHYDLTAQALARIERGHRQDLVDVKEMLERNLITRHGVMAYFERVESAVYRFPAIDAGEFRRAVERFASG